MSIRLGTQRPSAAVVRLAYRAFRRTVSRRPSPAAVRWHQMLQAERLADLTPGTLSPLRRKLRRQWPSKRMMDSCRQRTGAGLRESLVRDWSVVSLPNGHSPRRSSTLPALPATDLRIGASTRGPRVQCHLLSLNQNLMGRLGKDSPRSMRGHSVASAVNFSQQAPAVDHSGGHPPARTHTPRREHKVARFGARGIRSPSFFGTQ
jgi:hypothetical protein